MRLSTVAAHVIQDKKWPTNKRLILCILVFNNNNLTEYDTVAYVRRPPAPFGPAQRPSKANRDIIPGQRPDECL